ncbi:hypothetical protein D3C73_1304710 [compost metagenome]
MGEGNAVSPYKTDPFSALRALWAADAKMAHRLTNLTDKRTVRGRTIRSTTFACRIFACKWLAPVSPPSRASPLPQLTAFQCGSGLAREEAGTANTNPGNDKGHPKVAFVW